MGGMYRAAGAGFDVEAASQNQGCGFHQVGSVRGNYGFRGVSRQARIFAADTADLAGRKRCIGLVPRQRQRVYSTRNRIPAPGASQSISRPNGILLDRKSTRLNSSHPSISYAVFCLKKKKKKHNISTF